MSLSKWAMPVLCLLLAACSGGNQDKDPGFTIPKDEKTNDTRQNYEETKTLSLSRTGYDLINSNKNIITMSGTGKASTYKAIYRFNSRQFTSFKIVASSLGFKTSSCPTPVYPEMTLKHRDQAERISPNQRQALTRHGNYILEVTFIQNCASVDLTYDLIVWAGGEEEVPALGYICQGTTIPQISFVPGLNSFSAFTTVSGKERFLSMDLFCGEEISPLKVRCSSRYESGLPYTSAEVSEAGCETQESANKKAFNVTIDSAKRSAHVSCSSSGTETFNESFGSCYSTLVDLKSFELQ